MKMTDVERITLIRLHEVLAALKPKEAKEHHVAIQILRDGYHEDLYEQRCGTYLAEPFAESDQKLVYDILDLYASLERSYAKLSKVEKKLIDKSALEFPGFDDASEGAYLGFARFVIKKQHRWTDVDHKSGFNSEKLMLPVYRRLLKEARRLKSGDREFTAEEISTLQDLSKSADKAPSVAE